MLKSHDILAMLRLHVYMQAVFRQSNRLNELFYACFGYDSCTCVESDSNSSDLLSILLAFVLRSSVAMSP
jgi:hypothetical protein